MAISPDLRWSPRPARTTRCGCGRCRISSKPPLHTLPHDELVAKLKSLTNLRAVRDPSRRTGWKIEFGPFPGWKDVPTW